MARIAIFFSVFAVMIVSAHARTKDAKIDACLGRTGEPVDDVISWCSDLIHEEKYPATVMHRPERYNYMRGLAFASKGDHEHAVEDFTKVVRADPRRANAYFYRARSYAALGKTDDAARDTAIFRQLRPEGNQIINDCLRVDWQSVSVRNIRGSWTVVQPSDRGYNSMLSFGGDRALAESAAATIRERQFDQHCYVERPFAPLQYWTSRGALPRVDQAMNSCQAFSNAALTRKVRDGVWHIDDDRQTVLVIGYDELVAENVFRALQDLRFTAKCTIGSTTDGLTLWMTE